MKFTPQLLLSTSKRSIGAISAARQRRYVAQFCADSFSPNLAHWQERDRLNAPAGVSHVVPQAEPSGSVTAYKVKAPSRRHGIRQQLKNIESGNADELDRDLASNKLHEARSFRENEVGTMTTEMEAQLAADLRAVADAPKHAEENMETTIVVAYREINNSGDYDAAQKKFDELDVNHDGELNEAEVKKLVEWVYATFQPPGYEPGAVDKKLLGREARKLIRTLDKDESKGVSFEEFFGYYDKKMKQAEAL